MSPGESPELENELDALRAGLPEQVPAATATKSAAQYYSKDVATRILDAYAQGKSLRAISHLAEMPCYTTLLRWGKEHTEFRAQLRAVREMRALHFEDAAITAAEAAEGKDKDRLLFDAYKWGAEVNDPTTYGKKVHASHEVTGGVTIQVVTGFDTPNAWQTPPKLREDGTIDKEFEAAKKATEVKSDVVTESSPDPGRAEESAGADRPHVDLGSSSRPEPDGV